MIHEHLLRIILTPHMSEKAAQGMEKCGQYVFQVCQYATKPEVKKAVEELFSVSVNAVRILNAKGKPKRFGKIEGYSKNWKKAYVTLQAGSRIDFAGTQ